MRQTLFQIVHHRTHSKEQRVFKSHGIVHPNFAKAALAPRRENRRMYIGICGNGIFERSHLDNIRTCCPFKHLFDEQRAFKPPMSKKFRIVRAKNRDLVAVHIREQIRNSLFAVRYEQTRMVFDQSQRIPRTINFFVFASGNAVILKPRFDVRSGGQEIFA